MKNYYEEDKPVLRYRPTRVEMGLVVSYLKSLPIPAEVKRASYIVFRLESANGAKGLNNNYVGAQADAGRWDKKFDDEIEGTVYKAENGTGKMRIFLAFYSYEGSIDFLTDRLAARGLYVSGHLVMNGIDLDMHINTVEDLCTGYHRSWAKGNNWYNPTDKEIGDFESMYRQASKLFI